MRVLDAWDARISRSTGFNYLFGLSGTCLRTEPFYLDKELGPDFDKGIEMLVLHSGLSAAKPKTNTIECFHKLRRLIHWPATPNPTPYEIFGLEPNKPVYDKQKLRDTYFKLVKLYHPDRGITGNTEKFKKVVEAHGILKDDTKRQSYDFARSQAAYQGSSRPFYTKSKKAFEDDIDINYWSNRNQHNFDKGLYESRIWVLKFVTTITITFAIFNLMLMKQASEARNEALSLETERAAAQLLRSFTNHGKGGDAQERIERFLNDRQRMLDRFDNEFSWEKFKSGKSHNASVRARLDPQSSPCEQEDIFAMCKEETAMQKASSIGKPQMKRHTGPVAEYFGRT